MFSGSYPGCSDQVEAAMHNADALAGITKFKLKLHFEKAIFWGAGT